MQDEAITIEEPQPPSPETPTGNEPEVKPEAPAADQPKENPAPEPAATGDEPESPEEAEPEKPKEPRAQRRIRQLNARLAEAKASSQPQAPAAPAAPGTVPPVDLNLPPGDYTPEQIQAHSIRVGQALSSIEVQQLRAEMAQKEIVGKAQQQFRDDLSDIETKYPELKEGSPQYDPNLADVVINLMDDAIQANPESASLSKIASQVMKLHQRTAASSGAEAAAAVASQRNGQAPAPTGSGPKGKAPEPDKFMQGFEDGFK